MVRGTLSGPWVLVDFDKTELPSRTVFSLILTGQDSTRLRAKNVYCTYSCLRCTNGSRVCNSAPMWVQVQVRGAFSGRPKSQAGNFLRDHFSAGTEPTEPKWKTTKKQTEQGALSSSLVSVSSHLDGKPGHVAHQTYSSGSAVVF